MLGPEKKTRGLALFSVRESNMPPEPPVCELASQIAVFRSEPTLENSRPWLGYSSFAARAWVLSASAILIAASAMSLGEHRAVYFPGFAQKVPETCAAYRFFGVNCPGCGLTRTFIHAAQGEIAAAIELNPVGLLVFAFTAIQIPIGFCQLCFSHHGRLLERWPRWNEWGMGCLLCALCIQWLLRLVLERFS